MATLKKENGLYTILYYCIPGLCSKHPHGHTRHHESLHTHDAKRAKTVFNDFQKKEKELRARHKLGLVVTVPDPTRTISQAAKEYYEHTAVEQAASTQKRAERPAIGSVVKILGDLPLVRIDLEAATRFRTTFLQNHANPTWNSRRATLRAIWNWFLARKWVSENPWSSVGSVTDIEDDHKLKPVTLQDLPKIIAALPDRFWQLVTLFLYKTMCRVSDMCNLRRDDVLRKDKVIRFRRPKQRRGVEQRCHFVGLTDDLLAIIEEAQSLCSSDFVFSRSERNGRPLKPRKVYQIVNNAGKRVNVVVSPHRLRKSGSTHSKPGEADIRTLQKILGHSDIRTTQKYLVPDLEYQTEILSRLNIDNLLSIPNTKYRECVLQSARKAQAARRATTKQRRPSTATVQKKDDIDRN